MNLADLKEQADILELTYPHNISESKLRKKIQNALDLGTDDDVEEAPKKAKKDTVTIHIAEDALFVVVQAKSIQIDTCTIRDEQTRFPTTYVDTGQVYVLATVGEKNAISSLKCTRRTRIGQI